MMLIFKMLKHCSTEKDGVTYCPARILWIAGSIAYFLYGGYQVWHSKTFDYVAFATGFAAIQASGAGAVKIKETTEQCPKVGVTRVKPESIQL